jgi:hypothetical protein
MPRTLTSQDDFSAARAMVDAAARARYLQGLIVAECPPLKGDEDD